MQCGSLCLSLTKLAQGMTLLQNAVGVSARSPADSTSSFSPSISPGKCSDESRNVNHKYTNICGNSAVLLYTIPAAQVAANDEVSSKKRKIKGGSNMTGTICV
jgi:hypothetical protein